VEKYKLQLAKAKEQTKVCTIQSINCS